MHLCKHYVPCCETLNDIMLGMVAAHRWIQVTLDPTTYTPWKSFNTLEQGGQCSLLSMVLSLSSLWTDQSFIINIDRQTLYMSGLLWKRKCLNKFIPSQQPQYKFLLILQPTKPPNIAFVQASQVISHMFTMGCQSILHDSFYQIRSSRSLLIQILY